MARTYNGVTIERDALKEILTALNIGHEALVEYEELMEMSGAVLAEGWDGAEQAMREHEKKIMRSAIDEVEAILELEG